MAFYRCYPLDDENRIAGPPRELSAENDGQALRIIAEAFLTEPLEVWRDSKFLARLTPAVAAAGSDWIIVIKT